MKDGSVTERIEVEQATPRVSVRNIGPGPGIIAWFVRRLVRKDLDRLAQIVQRSTS